MIGDLSGVKKIYLITGRTDMRKSIEGLMGIIKDVYDLDPYANAAFFFCSEHLKWPWLDGFSRSILRQKKAAAYCGSGLNLLSGRYFFSKHPELCAGHSILFPDFPALSGFAFINSWQINYSSPAFSSSGFSSSSTSSISASS